MRWPGCYIPPIPGKNVLVDTYCYCWTLTWENRTIWTLILSVKEESDSIYSSKRWLKFLTFIIQARKIPWIFIESFYRGIPNILKIFRIWVLKGNKSPSEHILWRNGFQICWNFPTPCTSKLLNQEKWI